MSRASDPADVVISVVEGEPVFTLGVGDQLETVIADHNGGCSALLSVRLHGLFYGENGGHTVVESRCQ